MGDLSKLKIAIGQPELVCASPSLNEQARDRMVGRAVDVGADLLVMPGSLSDASDVHLVVLNDSRLDVAGSAVSLEACGETYRIGLDPDDSSCDFAVLGDVTPWTITGAPVVRPAALRRVPTVVLRPVGMRNQGKDVLAYDGGTKAFRSDGSIAAALRDDFEEDLVLVQFDEKNRMQAPGKDKVLAGIVRTMQRFDEQVLPWSPKWVIGLSGGLDSSVVAVLLTLAFGAERVIGYNLATRFNSDTTKSNAASLAEALGIPLRNGSIEALVDATDDTLGQYGYEGALKGVVLENVQARVRGHLLSTFAAVEGGVVANNGNRVECALGYATLYGDAIGALAPIGDLTKVRLFDLARAINGDSVTTVIPDNLLPRIIEDGYEWQTPPSAELAEGQLDPMKWFYHDWLIERLLDANDIDEAACDVMERYLSDRLKGTEVGKWVGFYGLDEPGAFIEDLDWVLRSIRNSAFKRIQSPPAIRIASPASAKSSQESQGLCEPSFQFERLRQRISRL